MGAFSGKFISDPGRYTFQQVLNRIAVALEEAESKKSDSLEPVQVEITIRGSEMVETIKIPPESLREVSEILKLNAQQ